MISHEKGENAAQDGNAVISVFNVQAEGPIRQVRRILFANAHGPEAQNPLARCQSEPFRGIFDFVRTAPAVNGECEKCRNANQFSKGELACAYLI